MMKNDMDKFFAAPEVSKNEGDERSDTWSVGIIMHILLTGVLPYDGDEYGDEVMEKQE